MKSLRKLSNGRQWSPWPTASPAIEPQKMASTMMTGCPFRNNGGFGRKIGPLKEGLYKYSVFGVIAYYCYSANSLRHSLVDIRI